MHFGPLSSFAVDSDFVELIQRFGCVLGELLGRAQFGDFAQVALDGTDYSGLFPSFTASCLLGSAFVRLPAALRQDPAAATGRLNDKNFGFVSRYSHHTSDETLALSAISCGRITRSALWQLKLRC